MSTTSTQNIVGRFASGRLVNGHARQVPGWLVRSDDAQTLTRLRQVLGSEQGPRDGEIQTISPLAHIWLHELDFSNHMLRVRFTLVHGRDLGMFEYTSSSNTLRTAWLDAGLEDKVAETGTPVRAILDMTPRDRNGFAVLGPMLTIREDLT